MDAQQDNTAETDANTQDYIDAIKEAKANGRSLSINYGDLPKGVVAAAVHTAMSEGLPTEYQDAIGEAASKGKTISLDFSQIKPQEDPKFYEIEKQQGLPQGPMGLIKQAGHQLMDAAMSPIPGSLLTMPVHVMQENAQQAGTEIAKRLIAKGLNRPMSRAAGFVSSAALDPTSYVAPEAELIKAPSIPLDRVAAVNAAKEAGIALTPAEATGNRALGGIESTLEKTLTGSEPINAARTAGNEAMAQFRNALKSKFGTVAEPSEVGNVVKSGAESTIQKIKAAAQSLYETLPNQKVQPEALRTASEDLLRQQYELPRSNRDGSLINMLNEYRKLGTKVVKSVDDNLQKTIYTRAENPSRYPSTNALRQMASDLGDAWRSSFKTGERMGNASGREATLLSTAIQNDLQAVASLKNQLDQANQLWRQAKNLDKNALIKRIRAAGPEQATDLIFDGRKVSNILMAKAALGKSYNIAKAAYFNKLVEHPQLGTQLDKMSGEYLRAAFSQEELSALRKVAAIQKIRGAAEKMGGQAGSARSNALSLNSGAIGAGLAVAGTSALHLNVPGVIGGLLSAGAAYKGPEIAANAYLAHGMSGVHVPIPMPGVGQTAHRATSKIDVNKIREFLMKKAGQR